MLERVNLHFVSERFFTGKELFTLKVGIDHDDGRLVVQFADKDRHRILSRQLAPALAAVSGNDLIAALGARTDNTGNQNAVLRDAVSHFLHGLVVSHLEWMVPEGIQFRKRDLPDLFLAGRRFAARLEQIVVAGQLGNSSFAYRPW